MTTPIYLIISIDHTAATEEIKFFARTPYQAKKALAEIALEEADKEEIGYFGVDPAPELEAGQSTTFVIQGEPGNQNRVLHLERIECVDKGVFFSSPTLQRTRLKTLRLQTVQPYERAVDSDEESSETESDSGSDSDEE